MNPMPEGRGFRPVILVSAAPVNWLAMLALNERGIEGEKLERADWVACSIIEWLIRAGYLSVAVIRLSMDAELNVRRYPTTG